MSTSDFKRVGLGLTASVGILIVLEMLASQLAYSGVTEQTATGSHFGRAVQAAVAMFIAASAGAYVARVGFVGAAVLLTVGIWLSLVCTVNAIAAAAGQPDLPAVAFQNGLSLIFGLAGAVAGAWLGRRLSGRADDVATAA